MKNQYGGSRTDTLIKLVLVFFLSLLSFSIGTFVGKQFSDSQHKIAALENGDSGNAERSAASIPDTKMEPNQAISEDEIAKLSEEFVKKERDDQNKNEAPAETSTATNDKVEKKAEPDSASIHDEISKVAKKLASGDRLQLSPKGKRLPSSLPKELADSPIGKYTVQVASQADEDSAQRKAEQLKDRGFSAFVVPAEVHGKKWYRVSVGQFDNRMAAIKYRAKLMKDAGIESAVIQKIGK